MILLTIGLPLILGWLILTNLLQKNSGDYRLIEKLALSFPLGLGGIAIIMFFLGVSGIPLTLLNILLTLGALSLALVFSSWRGGLLSLKQVQFNWQCPNLEPPEKLLAALIGLKVVFVFFSALVKPMIDVDGFQQYAIVAKGIFFDHSFTLPYLFPFYGDKPLFPFLAQGWVLLSLGQPNDLWLKLIPALFFLCLLVIFYYVVRRNTNLKMALLFTWLLSTLPFLVYHATTAYADLQITLFYSIGTFYLFLFMQRPTEQKNSNLLLAALFLGLTVWGKKAGIVLAGIDIFVLAMFLFINHPELLKKNWKQLALVGLIFTIIALPVIAQGRMETVIRVAGLGQPAMTETTATDPNIENIFGTNLSLIGKKLFLYNDWMLAWGLLLFSLAFFWRQILTPPRMALLTMLLLGVLALFVQFGSAETQRWLLDGTLFDRLVMNQAAIVMFLSAVSIGLEITAKSKNSRPASKKQ